MKIFVIAARIEGEETPWILQAWDEWTVDANSQGWDDEVQKAKVKAGAGTEIRVATVTVPDSFLFDVFKIVDVKGTVS